MAAAKKQTLWLLALIVAVYCVLGTLYAAQTPRWQTPDEPAHFNYIRYLAENARLPVLQVGDFAAQYLEQIKAAHFPPEMPIDSIRYESHQPPLYYALAAVVYHVSAGLGFAGQFLALRLFSVLLGAGLLLVIYALVREVFPEDPLVPLAATALVACVPMHLALTAAINNDTLAELLLALVLWQSVRALREGLSTRRAIATGVALGLAGLTKTTVYLPLAVAALPAMWAHPQGGLRARLRYLLALAVPVLLLVTPWLVRNAVVYGGLDVLAWQRHELVAAGQMRSAERLAQIGAARFAQEFALTTFRSFWAQFGWMGVPVDQRIYLGLVLFCGLLAVGLLVFVLRARSGALTVSPFQRRALWLLTAAAGLSIATFLGYNMGFLQPQGRYLFTALGPLALFAGLSLRELLRPRTARCVAGALVALGIALLAFGLLRVNVSRWGLALLAACAAFFTSAGWLPARWRWLSPAALLAAFVALDLACLWAYVVPFLR